MTAETGRVFGAIRQSAPEVRIADFSATGDRQFITKNERTTFALVFTPPHSGYNDREITPAISRALRRRYPPSGTSGSPASGCYRTATNVKGTAIMTETMIGSMSSLLILALLLGSFLELLPLLIAGVSVLDTFLIVGGLTEITGIS